MPASGAAPCNCPSGAPRLRRTPSTRRRCASLMTTLRGRLRASPAFRAFSRAARAAAPASALTSLSALSFACARFCDPSKAQHLTGQMLWRVWWDRPAYWTA